MVEVARKLETVVVVMVTVMGVGGNLVTSDQVINKGQLDSYPREWPCPIDTDILPCVCTDDEYYNLTMDCSGVQSDQDLVNAFNGVVFPFIHFLEFKINHIPDDPNNDLTTIDIGTLGETTYEIINIHGTNLQSVHDEAFANSHAYLRILDLSGNKLQSFPFESLSTYSVLHTFRIDDNNFLTLPPIESATLEIFGADDNRGVVLQPSVFTGAPALKEIYMARCVLSSLTDNMVTNQTDLRILDLEENELTQLELNDIAPKNSTLQRLNLSKNRINYIRHDAISGEPS